MFACSAFAVITLLEFMGSDLFSFSVTLQVTAGTTDKADLHFVGTYGYKNGISIYLSEKSCIFREKALPLFAKRGKGIVEMLCR